MRKLFGLAFIVLAFGLSAWAQEIRHEFTLQGSGFFPMEKTGNSGVTSKPTYSGGVMAGYRFNLTESLAVEGDYDYFHNSTTYFTSGGSTRIPANVHAFTGVAVVNLPVLPRFRPFALVGAGAMVFDPRNCDGISRQTRGAFVYGGGLDYPMMKHVAIRAQYRGFLYKVADYDLNELKLERWTHAAVPSAGLVLTF